jgi:hypothetical protein
VAGAGRQAGRDALARLVTAWKAGSDPGGPGRSGGGLNGTAEAVPAGQPERARAGIPDRHGNTADYSRLPGWLQTGAAWSWRLLLLAAALYLIARVIGVLYIVVVPCTAALLLTALLQPLTARLRRAGLPGLAATWGTLEGHLLQPQVVGRVIRLHPLAIILSLAVGSVLAGIAGAVVAVPIVAVITRAVPELRRQDPAPGGP